MSIEGGNGTSALRPGAEVWIPCEVKPGPFSDERMVRITSDLGEWLGFVPIWSLREPLQEGKTYIKGIVETVEEDRFTARLPGHSIDSSRFAGSISRVERVGTVQA